MAGNTEEAGSLLAGRYRLSNRIGSGGHGAVWEARDEVLERTVALRRVYWPVEWTEDDAELGRRRVRHEFLRLAGYQGNRHIVPLYDVLDDDEGLWVVMVYVAGARTLADVLRESGPLPPARVARIGLDVLDALRTMHQEGVTHGALTPQTVVVTPEDEILLAGFDEAILRDVRRHRLTMADTVVGTPRFMAPELASGGPVTPAADLFSLGAVLYRAVEGHDPFDGRTAIEELNAVLFGEPATPARAGALAPLLRRLLEKDPSRRPTGDELAVLLRGVEAQRDAWAVPQRPVAAGSDVGAAPTPYVTSAPPPGMANPMSHLGLAGRWNDAWAWTGLLIACLTAVLLAVFVGYVLPSVDGMWWLPGLWVLLVAGAVVNVLRRTETSEAAAAATTVPAEIRSAPRRGAAVLAGFTDAAVFLRPRTAVPPLPPTRDACLREAYNRLGPPPAAGPRTAGGPE